MPLSEDENHGIELVKECEGDTDGIHQTHEVPTPTTGHFPAPYTPQDTNEIRETKDKQQDDHSPGTSSSITRCTPRPNSEKQSIQCTIANNSEADGGDPQLSPAKVIMDNLNHIEKITFQDGRQLFLGKDWGREIIIPHKNKGKGKSTTRARQESAQREQESAPSGQEAGCEEISPNARPGEELENITITENERRRQRRDRKEEEEEDTHLDDSNQEEAHEENDREVDQEVEVTTEVVQPKVPVLLNFQPINPYNVRMVNNNKEELDLARYFPKHTSTPTPPGGRKTNLNQDPEERQLYV